METEFWLEKNWGGSIDNAATDDINNAIKEIIVNRKENSRFWIGHNSEEYVLQINKNLEIIFLYGKNQDRQLKLKFHDWQEIQYFISKYLTKDFLLLKDEMELRFLQLN